MKSLRSYLILKPFLTTIFLLGIFYILEYGFNFDSWERLPQPLLLSILTTIMVFKPNFRRFILFMTGFCLVLMMIFNLLNLPNFSKVIGDFGFSLLVITIVLYLPKIIKKGYIEKF